MMDPSLFQTLLLNWFQNHGRKQLPWQNPRTPYRIWISEIMLQQTQVATVIPYFERFMQAFPTVTALAQADQDSILHLWAGLGYYARARNLYQTAQQVTQGLHGVFPNDLESLQRLPGIGRSTAGAILSLGFNQAAPILDGNVKRILCRVHMVDGFLNDGSVTKQLWQLAERYVSSEYPSDYTQAIMDLGSLVCTRAQPRCHHCPFAFHCCAYQQGKTDQYPRSKPRTPLMTRHANFVILLNAKQEILLEKRPPIGIWGGLWSVPECDKDTDLKTWCTDTYGWTIDTMTPYPMIHHTFSHFRLAIHPIICRIKTTHLSLQDNTTHHWIHRTALKHKGLAAPVKKLLQHLSEQID